MSMLLKKFFGADKKNLIAQNVVVKRMSADIAKLASDSDEAQSLYQMASIQHTLHGRTVQERLVRCRDSLKVLSNLIKRNRIEVYYIPLREFCIECRNDAGAMIKSKVKFDVLSAQFASWLQMNGGDDITPEKLSGFFDGKNLPDWINVSASEQIAEPLPVQSGVQDPSSESAAGIGPGALLFGQYRIERELGEGGMGKVFLAEDIKTMIQARKNVVLKVLHIENAHDEKAQAQFIKEAETLAGLQNDRIAACYNGLMYGDVPILIMEYIEGKTLDKYLAEHDGNIDEKKTKELLLPIAEALDYAHRMNIYHLDVKPQNIIVRDTPKAGIRTCLLDFGIARRNHADGAFTYTKNIAGTKQYMSPDQYTEFPNAAMDVYSLAVTAYECLAGRLPYPEGYRRTAIIQELTPDTLFTQTIMKGICGEPEKRPKTCVQLIKPDPMPVLRPMKHPKPAKVAPRKEKETAGNAVLPLAALKKSFEKYRMMLAQSAKKAERSDAKFAEYLKDRQGVLRDLTKDLDGADDDRLVDFFKDIRKDIVERNASPEDFFCATDRLVELRAGLPEKGGDVWRAMRESIVM